jgi:hypothetical protein
MKTIRNLILTSIALLATAAAFAAKPISRPQRRQNRHHGGSPCGVLRGEGPHGHRFLLRQGPQTCRPSGQVVSAVAEAKTGKVNLASRPRTARLFRLLRCPKATAIASSCRSVTRPKPSPRTIAWNFTTTSAVSANGPNTPASARSTAKRAASTSTEAGQARLVPPPSAAG